MKEHDQMLEADTTHSVLDLSQFDLDQSYLFMKRTLSGSVSTGESTELNNLPNLTDK